VGRRLINRAQNLRATWTPAIHTGLVGAVLAPDVDVPSGMQESRLWPAAADGRNSVMAAGIGCMAIRRDRRVQAVAITG